METCYPDESERWKKKWVKKKLNKMTSKKNKGIRRFVGWVMRYNKSWFGKYNHLMNECLEGIKELNDTEKKELKEFFWAIGSVCTDNDGNLEIYNKVVETPASNNKCK